MVVQLAAFVPSLTKDTTADAFIAKDNPAVIYRDRVKEIFGLEDPFVVAVLHDTPQGVYTAQSLELVRVLTNAVSELPNIDPERVTSLATEKNIVGTFDGMEAEYFYELGDDTSPQPALIREAVEDFPLYQGSLVARDATVTVIVAEMLDNDAAQSTYDAILEVVDSVAIPEGHEVHVAGEGAVSGYLATYIDRDARRLNPLVAVVITLVLIIAFRTVMGALLPNLIVLATVAGAIGTMAASATPFFVITNGLPAILIAIAVADAIHILSAFYEHAARDRDASSRELIVRAMVEMWRPVTLTTLTTVAGFMGLWIGAAMPPMAYFGLFASIGVGVAWLYSIFFLPAVVTVLRVRPSRAFKTAGDPGRSARLLEWLGRSVLRAPWVSVLAVSVIAIIGTVGATRVVVEEAQIENFQTDEPIYVADKAMNAAIDGTYYLDVVVETDAREELFKPARLRAIEKMQRYGETLAGVQGSTSVVDYIKQMHRAVNENDPAFYTIPDDEFLIAQLFLLYSASGDPTDFEEKVDYDYRMANVRFNLNTSLFTNNREVVRDLERYVAQEFDRDGMQGHLSGRVFVNFHWMKTIGDSHARSVAISLVLVWLMASVVFRSLLGGLFSLIPVAMSVLLVYAVMGFGGIWLGVGTSMFAAIAIGLGIDFAIHTIDRMRELNLSRSGSFDERIAELFPTTGRALLFNFAAIALGFLVLTTSEVPPLVKFGSLVVVAVSSAFFASMTALPALAKLLRPRFLGFEAGEARRVRALGASTVVVVIALLAAVTIYEARADAAPSGLEIMQSVVARDEGEYVTRKLRMEMTDRRGVTRVRETHGYRRYFGAEKRTVVFYLSPTNVKGTGFLTYDYPDAERDDDQWLYLPALRKVRRISASDRGDYFLGTDFTYEDVKKEGKVALE
ncbi:MAG: MMPL family transporter, partial [Pseudomonadales bacterium]